MTTINNVTAAVKPYATTFKGWQAKVLGAKPEGEALAMVHLLGLRPGKQALAVAMGLRPEGVSGSQIVMACGAPQLNRMRGLIAAGHVKREAVAPNAQGHTVYKLTLTAKGEAAAKRAAEAVAKAALVADTPKPAKVKKAGSKRKGGAKAKPAPVTTEAPAAPTPQPEADDRPANSTQFA